MWVWCSLKTLVTFKNSRRSATGYWSSLTSSSYSFNDSRCPFKGGWTKLVTPNANFRWNGILFWHTFSFFHFFGLEHSFWYFFWNILFVLGRKSLKPTTKKIRSELTLLWHEMQTFHIRTDGKIMMIIAWKATGCKRKRRAVKDKPVIF